MLGHDEVAVLLVKAGTDSDIPDLTGVTTLMDAAREGSAKLVKLLLAGAPCAVKKALKSCKKNCKMVQVDPKCTPIFGAKMNLQDKEGNTAAHHAALQGRKESLHLLISAKTRRTLANTEKQTILQVDGHGYVKEWFAEEACRKRGYKTCESENAAHAKRKAALAKKALIAKRKKGAAAREKAKAEGELR